MSNPDQQLKQFGWMLHAGGAAVAFLGSVAVWMFLLNPMQVKIDRADRETMAVKRFMNRSGTIVAQETALKTQVEDSRNSLEQLRKRVPSTSEKLEFFDMFHQLAAKTGFSVTNYEPKDAKKLKTHSEIPIEVVGKASYRSLCKLLDGIAQLPRLCRVREMKITSNEDAFEYPITLSLSIYYSDEETLAGFVTQPFPADMLRQLRPEVATVPGDSNPL